MNRMGTIAMMLQDLRHALNEGLDVRERIERINKEWQYLTEVQKALLISVCQKRTTSRY